MTRAPRTATSPEDSLWRRMVSPSTWVVLLVGGVVATYGVWVTAADPDGQLGVIGWVLLTPGSLVTAWACLNALWRPDSALGSLNLSAARAVFVPLVATPPLGGLVLLLQQVPPFAGRISEHTHPDWYSPHYWFDQEGAPLPVLVLAGGLVFAMAAGIATIAFLVWPIEALWAPDRMIADSWLDTGEETRATNRFAVRAYAALLPLALVLAFLMSQGQRVAGVVVLVPLAVLTWLARRHQRVDHARRAGLPAIFRGIPNADDPPPSGR